MGAATLLLAQPATLAPHNLGNFPADTVVHLTLGRHQVSPIALLFGTAIALPVVATVVMGFMEEGVDKLGWRGRLVKMGWDLCILSVGTAGIYATPSMVEDWGAAAPLFAAASVVISLLCTVLIAPLRKLEASTVTGWHGLVALALGGGALGMPIYFVLHTR